MIIGPDQYRYRVLQQPADRKERFQYVALRVKSLSKAVEFYEKALGMLDLTPDFEHLAFNRGGAAFLRAVGYAHDKEEMPLLLFEDQSQPGKVTLEQWEGRHAIRVPGAELRALYSCLQEDAHGGSILHPLREFNEMPALRRARGLPPMLCNPPPVSVEEHGHLAVAIVTDTDGYEICLVSSEMYNAAVAAAYTDDAEIDWAWRGLAREGKREPTPPHMLACI